AQFDAMLRRALVRRSDVLVKIAAYGAAEARLRVTLAELTPDITMGPGILWDQKDLVLRLAGAIVPVPEITDARVAIALAHRDEARLAFEEMQAQVLAEAESAWSQLATAGRESASAEAEITAASEYAAQTATAIRQRTLPAAAKPDADLRLLAARRAAAAAELRRQMALINLEFAMERIFSDDSVPRGAPWHRPSRDD
ncbi:MAG: TolC family protein, partial [Rhodospirillales bacterium]|nr:TolC family protein [Rhodospirillales bacterium]